MEPPPITLSSRTPHMEPPPITLSSRITTHGATTYHPKQSHTAHVDVALARARVCVCVWVCVLSLFKGGYNKSIGKNWVGTLRNKDGDKTLQMKHGKGIPPLSALPRVSSLPRKRVHATHSQSTHTHKVSSASSSRASSATNSAAQSRSGSPEKDRHTPVGTLSVHIHCTMAMCM